MLFFFLFHLLIWKRFEWLLFMIWMRFPLLLSSDKTEYLIIGCDTIFFDICSALIGAM